MRVYYFNRYGRYKILHAFHVFVMFLVFITILSVKNFLLHTLFFKKINIDIAKIRLKFSRHGLFIKMEAYVKLVSYVTWYFSAYKVMHVKLNWKSDHLFVYIGLK